MFLENNRLDISHRVFHVKNGGSNKTYYNGNFHKWQAKSHAKAKCNTFAWLVTTIYDPMRG